LVALSAAEQLALVGNQWALAKAGVIPLAHFFTTLAGFRNESDRAVLSAITDRLLWIDMHVVDDAMRPAFERRMNEFFTPYFERIGWNRHEEESADDGLRRATILAAMGELAASTEVKEEARNRLERFLREPSSLDPNLASVVVSLAAQNGDAQLFDRYLERKRAAGDDPETEQRFLFGLTAFEPPELVERCLQLCQSDEVRPQDRAHLLARLLGSRSARSAAWEFVQRCWDDLTAGMDPMLQQNVVRGLAQLTYAPVAGQAQSFLASHVTDETRETVAQVSEQLGIDATACQRLAPEMRNVLEGPEPDVE
jgi:aminopeptidase N